MSEQLQSDFDKIIKTSKISEEEIQIKKDFLNKFIKSGFPNRKQEDWKFLDISQIIKKNISNLSFFNDYSIPNKFDPSSFVDGLEHNKIIFINGRIEKIDFNYEEQNKIEISDEIKKDISFDYKNSLIDLNSAFTHKVFKIFIKKNYSLKKPLIIYHSTDDKIKSTNINLRLDFELGENSCLRLIDFFTNKTAKNFINIFYNFNLEKNSVLKNYKIDKFENKNLKYSFNNIEQGNNSVSETFILSAGSDYLKNEINCNLNGEYSSAFINGVFSLKENQQALNNYFLLIQNLISN